MSKAIITNLLTPESLDRLTPVELRELPIAVLADLQRQLNDSGAVQERRKAVLWDICNERFAAQAQNARLADVRDTGTVHLLVDDCDVACTTSKRITWDEAKLVAALGTLSAADRKSTRLNSSHRSLSRMPSSA